MLEYLRGNRWTAAQVEGIELAAGPVLMEPSMEARIARLEADVAHIRSDVSDIKGDVRARFDRLDTRIDRLETKVDGKLDSLKSQIESAKIWALLLYFALAAGMLGTLARAFGWI